MCRPLEKRDFPPLYYHSVRYLSFTHNKLLLSEDRFFFPSFYRLLHPPLHFTPPSSLRLFRIYERLPPEAPEILRLFFAALGSDGSSTYPFSPPLLECPAPPKTGFTFSELLSDLSPLKSRLFCLLCDGFCSCYQIPPPPRGFFFPP